jgi:hypothetical protein
VTALAKATAKSCAGFDAHKTIPMGSRPIQTDAVCSHPARKWLEDTLIRCAFSMPKSVFFHSKLINQKLYLLFYFQENLNSSVTIAYMNWQLNQSQIQSGSGKLKIAPKMSSLDTVTAICKVPFYMGSRSESQYQDVPAALSTSGVIDNL